MDKLKHAIGMIEDALIQGRHLEIKFTFNYDEGHETDTVDVSIEEMSGINLEIKHIFSDLNFETFEEALIAVGKNL